MNFPAVAFSFCFVHFCRAKMGLLTLPAGCVMEQIAGPQLAKKDWQSNEKFPARAGQAYIFVVKKK